MKTTKGGKVMNPTNAYRKELCEKIIEEAYGVMAYATQVRPGDFIAIGTRVLVLEVVGAVGSLKLLQVLLHHF
ncbi:hypothetical protein ACSQ67_002727 [Phaseolus vulgaris]